MSEVVLKNGLTPSQVEAAKGIFKQVSLRKVCKDAGTNYATVNNVLRDRSYNVEALANALIEANRILDRRKGILQTLPKVLKVA